MTPETDPLTEARQIALRRLDRRECSTGDISQCLKRKKFSSDIITQVVSELVEKKYINNEKYARIVVREQALRGKGPNWIRMKLKEKGISTERESIEVLMKDVAGTSELNVAKAVVSRRYPQAKANPVIAKKAIQALLRRGFSYGIAREALATFDQELKD
ncbi:MAG: regulatory protein RecX [Bdellovibrionia bacterium]